MLRCALKECPVKIQLENQTRWVEHHKIVNVLRPPKPQTPMQEWSPKNPCGILTYGWMYVRGAYGWYVGSQGLRKVFIDNRLSKQLNLLMLQPFHIMQPGSEHRDGLVVWTSNTTCNVVCCSILGLRGCLHGPAPSWLHEASCHSSRSLRNALTSCLVISKSSPLDFLGFNDTLLLSVHPTEANGVHQLLHEGKRPMVKMCPLCTPLRISKSQTPSTYPSEVTYPKEVI